MKSFKLFAAVALVVFASVQVNAKDANEVFEIETSTAVSSSNAKVYFLKSDVLNQKYSVEVNHFENGSDYVVKAADFEVLYRLRGDKFGVCYVNDANAEVGKDTMYSKLNRKNFLYQKLITSNPKSEEQYVQLIAAYLPDLIQK